MPNELVIRVTALQVTLLPLHNVPGAFVATIAATVTGQHTDASSRQAESRRGPLPASNEPPPAREDRGISDAQRRMLWRLAMQLGYEGPNASGFLRQRLGVGDVGEASKADASKLITALEAELRNGGNGHAAP